MSQPATQPRKDTPPPPTRPPTKRQDPTTRPPDNRPPTRNPQAGNPRSRFGRWLDYALGAAVPLVVVVLLLDGGRWSA